jgi:4-methylaminobutanoate oxidase (formaldehyde-forming)
MLPVMRDPDGFIYYKEEVGGLVMGGFEPKAKPWSVDPIPATFRFELLGEDWDQFEPLMTAAMHRTPCLETAQVKMLLNGPESFTPDGNFILGEAPELRRYFAAGFNSAGIANSGGAGRLLAEWIVEGSRRATSGRRHPPLRPFMANRKLLSERTGETSACTTRCAGRGRSSRRRDRCAPRRSTTCSPPAARCSVRRTAGSAPTISFAPTPASRRARAAPSVRTLDKPHWLADVIAEQRATREAVAVYDQTSFGKLLLQAAAPSPCSSGSAPTPSTSPRGAWSTPRC